MGLASITTTPVGESLLRRRRFHYSHYYCYLVFPIFLEVWYHERALLQDMLMPFGEITSADAKEIEENTKCSVEICTFADWRTRELRIWGKPEMLSYGYGETFVKVLQHGGTCGQQSEEDQHKVNEEFVKANPEGCHKRKSIFTKTTPRSSADDAPSPMTTARASADDAPTPMTTARASKDDEPTPMTPARASKDDEPQTKAPMPPKTPMPTKRETT